MEEKTHGFPHTYCTVTVQGVTSILTEVVGKCLIQPHNSVQSTDRLGHQGDMADDSAESSQNVTVTVQQLRGNQNETATKKEKKNTHSSLLNTYCTETVHGVTCAVTEVVSMCHCSATHTTQNRTHRALSHTCHRTEGSQAL